MPSPRFQKFEKVLIVNDRMSVEFFGKTGTVIWQDKPYFNRRTGCWTEWISIGSFPEIDRYCSFLESDLQGTGTLEAETKHVGHRHEISFDHIMIEDMNAVEGCYRLPGQFWQVLTFFKGDVFELRHHFGTWQSGITGIEFDVPREATLNREFVVRSMSEVFGAEPWAEVRGPDSLVLK